MQSTIITNLLAQPLFTLLTLLVLLTTSVATNNHNHANAGAYGSEYGMAYAHGYAYAYGGMDDAGSNSNGGGSHAAGAAAAGSGSDGNGGSGYWSEASVVDSFTTICPEPTVFTYKDKQYTATKSGETITISDCPCTVTTTCSYTVSDRGPGKDTSHVVVATAVHAS